MSEHIIIPKNVSKTFNMKTFFQINNVPEERRINIGISEDLLEVTFYGDMMYEDKEALGIFGLLHCTQHTIKYNNKTRKLYLVTKLNLLNIEVDKILDALQKCYAIIRERKRLTLTSIFDRTSYEMNVTPSPDILPVKQIKTPSYSLDRRAPDIL